MALYKSSMFVLHGTIVGYMEQVVRVQQVNCRFEKNGCFSGSQFTQ